MNKSIFITIFLFMVGMGAYAQYGSIYKGAAPTAALQPALPGAGVGANTGLSIQNGNDHKVRVRQAGTEQSAYTVQDDGTGLGGNQALVRQTGAVNANSGYRNAADVYQSGTANESRSHQEGDLNSAVTKQGQVDTGSEGNKGLIRQGTGDQAENNVAALEQNGDFNQGRILQTWDNSEAWMRQFGDNNKAKTIQNAAPENTAGHYAYTDQVGDGNESSIYQSGEGQANWAWAFQVGDDNQAIQTQAQTDMVGTAFVNYAQVDQGADEMGYLEEYESTETNLLALDADFGTVTKNTAATEGSLAFQNQDGGDLDAETHQFGSDNYSEQNQTGYGNDAFILQNTHGVGNNYARQDQLSATASNAALAQYGNGNMAWQRQSGDDNDIMSTQFGDHNMLNTYQDGDGNRGITTQNGDCNAALLVQRGGHSYTVEQIGTGNQADILQLGPDGDFATDGIDCTFDDPMISNENYNIPDLDLGDICPDCD